MRHYANVFIALILGMVFLLAATAGALAQIRVPSEEVEKILTIRDVTVTENRLLGEITNNSPVKIRDVSLMVQQGWRWKDGLNPKVEAPLNAFLLNLKKDLLPGETATFSSVIALPETDRIDAQFIADVSVAGFTLVVPEEPTPLSIRY
jgi:hypothetical protein